MTHVPVLAAEAIEALAIRPGGVYVAGTFGRGGHSRLLLERLGPRGRLIALDRDPQAVVAARAIADARLSITHARFSALAKVLDAQGAALADGMLFDLGVSSPQLDDAQRGFSFRSEGPLDMRMDPSQGTSAADWLANAQQDQIREVIGGYGEERFAKQIAAALVAARRVAPIRTTRQLADLVGAAVRTREPGQDPATRTFQALRILVNRELEEVSLMLPQAIERLAPGGRLAVIAFHSLEDRLVKRAFAEWSASCICPPKQPVCTCRGQALGTTVTLKPIRPSPAEAQENPRARSALLRAWRRAA